MNKDAENNALFREDIFKKMKQSRFTLCIACYYWRSILKPRQAMYFQVMCIKRKGRTAYPKVGP